MILLVAFVLGLFFIVSTQFINNKRKLYKTQYIMLNNIYDNIILKIINIKDFEETKNIDNIINRNIYELKNHIYKLNTNNEHSIDERKAMISTISQIEKLSLIIDSISKKENNYVDVLNDLSYKIGNLKNKYTKNNSYKSIGNKIEIDYIIDNLYYQRDNLNKIHIQK